MFKTIKRFIILAACSFTLGVQAQQAEHFLQGGWRISNQQTYTRITLGTLPDSMLFQINSVLLVDNKKARFTATTNLGSYKLEEGSSAFLEAKELHMTLSKDGTYMFPTWEVVDDAIPFHKLQWFFDPAENEIITVGSFASPKMFVLGINSKSTGCQPGTMTIYVDSNPIVDKDGNVLPFLEGSSVIGIGKLIQIRISGQCDSRGLQYGGVLKVAK